MADLLKVSFFPQANFLTENFAQSAKKYVIFFVKL